MTAPRYLTKSRFKLAVECPTKLFYTGKPNEYRDLLQENEFLAMLAEGGYQVGALAKLRYPEGIEIEGLDHAHAEAATKKHLERENVILFEPAIRFGKFFVRIDILVKNGNCFELIEVKAKSYNSRNPCIEGKRGSISMDMRPYIQDAAFQTWVLKQAIPQAEIKTYLMMPDKSKKSPVDGVNQIFKIKQTHNSGITLRPPMDVDTKVLSEYLLEKVCVDQYVEHVLANTIKFPGGKQFLSDAAVLWAEAYSSDQKIPPVIGKHCGGCQFKSTLDDSLKSGFMECWSQAAKMNPQDFESGTVLDIWHFRGKQKLIERGIFKISQVNRDDLAKFHESNTTGLSRAQRQWLQIGGIPSDHQHKGFYFNDEVVQSEMAGWKYPRHFIDFETATVALPFYKNMRPYEPVAFQFSHHIMNEDGSIHHAGEFICTEPGRFPNFEFARALMRELEQDDGTVFMWSHHENTILSDIIDQLNEMSAPPDDRDELVGFLSTLVKGGARAMVDLCKLSEKVFFHPDTKGSNSIKKVLPAVLKISPFLQRTYSTPVYGSPTGMVSKNFSCQDGFVWLDKTNDPYAKLKQFARDLLPEGATEDSVIAEGGAAATAYARLQFEEIHGDERKRINAALLRYCELDTLAMVMVIQAWTDMVIQALQHMLEEV